VSSGFGISTNPPSPFAVLGPGTSAFENTNSNNNAPISPFGVTSSPFGVQNQSQPSAFGGPKASTSVFGSNQPSAFCSSSGSAFSNVDAPKPSGPSKLKTGPPDFQNAPSKYVPGASTNKYDALLPNNYIDSLPASAREAFEAKKFQWGKIPEWIPPVEFR
jgi:nucleoporin NUP42